MEKSFKSEIELLRLGSGETFHGEGILAITKALLQSGVSYVGGYQGAPVSHLLDVMVQSSDYMKELGVHVEACSNEASAAAMLGASIHYPIRGAVTWKSIVGDLPERHIVWRVVQDHVKKDLLFLGCQLLEVKHLYGL